MVIIHIQCNSQGVDTGGGRGGLDVLVCVHKIVLPQSKYRSLGVEVGGGLSPSPSVYTLVITSYVHYEQILCSHTCTVVVNFVATLGRGTI